MLLRQIERRNKESRMKIYRIACTLATVLCTGSAVGQSAKQVSVIPVAIRFCFTRSSFPSRAPNVTLRSYASFAFGRKNENVRVNCIADNFRNARSRSAVRSQMPRLAGPRRRYLLRVQSHRLAQKLHRVLLQR